MEPKILVISMNSFSKTKNNGKTLETIFESYPKNCLAHIYFILEEEDLSFCNQSLRFHIYEAFDNVFRLKKRDYGTILNNENNLPNNCNKKYRKIVNKKYLKNQKYSKMNIPVNIEHIKKKNNLVYEILWFHQKWYLEKIKAYIDKVKPDIIFYQSNMYSFLHKLVIKIAKEFDLPIIVQCTDDYTIPHIPKSFVNKFLTKYYLYNFKKILNISNTLLAISDEMAEEYSKKFFKGKSYIFSNFVERNNSIDNSYLNDTKRIIYAGNLGLNRWKTILSLGKAIDMFNSSNNSTKYVIDIYSADCLSVEMEENFKNVNSIIFHGFLSSNNLTEEIQKANFLLCCESFDIVSKRVTRLSISTKIGEYICAGKCIIAIGPEDVASIKYLKRNNLANVITSNEIGAIFSNIKFLFEHPEKSIEYIKNTEKEKQQRFNKEYINRILKEMIENAIHSKKEME